MNSLQNIRCLRHKRFTIKCSDCFKFKKDPEKSLKEYFPNFIRIFHQDKDFNVRCDLCNLLLRVNRLSGITDHLNTKSHMQLDNKFWKRQEVKSIKIEELNIFKRTSYLKHEICIELEDNPKFFILLEMVKRSVKFLEQNHQFRFLF